MPIEESDAYVQLNANAQLQTSNKYALLNNNFQLNEQLQALDKYCLPDNCVQPNEYKPIDEYSLVHHNPFDGAHLCLPMNGYDELIRYIDEQQHNSLGESSESLHINWHNMQDNAYYGGVQSDNSNQISSGVTDINNTHSSASLCSNNSDTSNAGFTGYLFSENLLTNPLFYTNNSI